MRPRLLLLALTLLLATPEGHARTVYRCVRDGTVSLSTAPEPGSKCVAKHFADDTAKLPNLWGNLGVVQGTLYERQQDGRTVYGTRRLPGACASDSACANAFAVYVGSTRKPRRSACSLALAPRSLG